jgi:hypothetical protein
MSKSRPKQQAKKEKNPLSRFVIVEAAVRNHVDRRLIDLLNTQGREESHYYGPHNELVTVGRTAVKRIRELTLKSGVTALIVDYFDGSIGMFKQYEITLMFPEGSEGSKTVDPSSKTLQSVARKSLWRRIFGIKS